MGVFYDCSSSSPVVPISQECGYTQPIQYWHLKVSEPLVVPLVQFQEIHLHDWLSKVFSRVVAFQFEEHDSPDEGDRG